MQKLGERIKFIRIQEKLTQDELSVKTGISRSNVSRIEKDEINPSAAAIAQICNVLSISAEWLLTGTGEIYRGTPPVTEETELLSYFKKLDPRGKARILERAAALLDEMEKQPPFRKTADIVNMQDRVQALQDEEDDDEDYTEMKVYDISASAGLGNYLYEDDSPFEMLSFPAEEVPDDADFGIRISGDSMEPRIHDGDIVWVRQQMAVDSGEIGVFILDGESLCKKLMVDHDRRRVQLVSLNRRYVPINVGRSQELRTVGKVLF